MSAWKVRGVSHKDRGTRIDICRGRFATINNFDVALKGFTGLWEIGERGMLENYICSLADMNLLSCKHHLEEGDY